MQKILIIDDEPSIRMALSGFFEDEGFAPLGAKNGEEGTRIFKDERPDIVLLDLKMPGMDGLQILKELKAIDDAPVLMLTGHGDISTAVQAMRMGACDFLLKPPDFDHLLLIVKRAIDDQNLRKAVCQLKSELGSSLELMLGKSPAMKGVIGQIQQVARSNFSVIIQGETGTGKSFAANIIHNLSSRAKGPFVVVDIGAVPETLAESELFGYERGAFTGAEKNKQGFFETAKNGTILLDELQNMSLHIQSKLLRVMEEKTVYLLGSTKPVHIDARIIGATNTDIGAAVYEKRFREDLFYRIDEFIIKVPPLRERPEDIEFFANQFITEAYYDTGANPLPLEEDGLRVFKEYNWPGNIRELKNVARRAVLAADSGIIRPKHIEFHSLHKPVVPEKAANISFYDNRTFVLKDVEQNVVRAALEYSKGNKSKAALLMQIDYKTLLRKLKQYGI